MVLNSLQMSNFRNVTKKKLVFAPTTLILGPNTAGKTNILEAIRLLSVAKSFRADREAEMIKIGNDFGRVKAEIKPNGDEENMEIEVMLTNGMVGGQNSPFKRCFINGVVKRQTDFVGFLKTVLFWPEDLKLVTDSPSIRRRYLDMVLLQTDREYSRSLNAYEKALRQRNKLLEKIREGEASRSQLMFWDHVLIKNGNYLTKQRENFINTVNIHPKPFGEFNVSYDASLISVARLEQYAHEEVAAGVTLVGPHRDDLLFFEKDRNLTKFGSRGEQRLLVLWLKLAELEFIKIYSNEKPVLLLDDIFSELDDVHRELVINLIKDQQTIATTADIHAIPKSALNSMKMIELG